MAKENKKIIKNLTHIEIVHDDPLSAAEFMREVFGAVQVEKQFSEFASKAFNTISIHMMFGGVVYQIVKPPEMLPSWCNQLEKNGPSIHNLCLQVNGADNLREKLLDKGVTELHNIPGFDLNLAGFTTDEPRDLYVFDASEQCGLRFEFIESAPEWEPGEQD